MEIVKLFYVTNKALLYTALKIPKNHLSTRCKVTTSRTQKNLHDPHVMELW